MSEMPTASAQIRDLLAAGLHGPRTLASWREMDRIMRRQREKHGYAETAWWFESERDVWRRRVTGAA